MIRDLDYQARVLARIDEYLDYLSQEKARADTVAKFARAQPALGIEVPDFAAHAWAKMNGAGKLPASRAAIPFSPRTDGTRQPVPNAMLKVPTGGGKTYLAVSAISRIFGRYTPPISEPEIPKG